jgi:hypothetical protein
MLDSSEIVGGVDGKVGGLADVAADEPIPVLVGRSLPRRVRVGKVHVNSAEFSQFCMAGHLNTTVVGQGAPRYSGMRSRISTIAASIASAPWFSGKSASHT